MKTKSKTIHNGPVNGKWIVKITVSQEEVIKLKRALDIVEKYKSAAMKAADLNFEDADWTMLKYHCKDKNEVEVTIDQGSCG